MITKGVSDDHYLVPRMGQERGDKEPFCTPYTAIFFKPSSGWFFTACKPRTFGSRIGYHFSGN